MFREAFFVERRWSVMILTRIAQGVDMMDQMCQTPHIVVLCIEPMERRGIKILCLMLILLKILMEGKRKGCEITVKSA